jgi:hypothetical protein
MSHSFSLCCVFQVFQKELGKRTGSVAALKRSAKDLIESSHEDSSWVKAQMQELSARWETVCARSVSKQTRLEQALSQVGLLLCQTSLHHSFKMVVFHDIFLCSFTDDQISQSPKIC